MAVETYNYRDLGGGRNSVASPVSRETREMAELRNWYPYDTVLRRRGGIRQVTTTAWTQRANALFPYKTSTGTWVLLVGGQSKFARMAGGGFVDLTEVGAPVIGNSPRPFVFFQYKNFAYALRSDSGSLLRLDVNTVATGGIAAPLVAPTIAAGGAGALGAGNYYGVFTYYNTASAMESNPSPVSLVLNLPAANHIDWSVVSVSPNPIVDARRLYRTVVGQTGMYYYIGTIPGNVNTTYDGDEVLPANMGGSASFNNGLPPAGLEIGVIWKERLFASTGTDLVFSQFLMPEMFGADLIPIFPDDGHTIRALHPFGDRLIIGKTNAIHYLVGTDPSNFAVHTLSDKHGVKSHYSMQSAESNLFFFGTGKAIFRSDGTYVRDISTPRVADILAEIPDLQEEFVIGATFPALNWYLLSVPKATSTPGLYEYRILVYNYKYDSWTVFDSTNPAPSFVGDMFDANYSHELYGIQSAEALSHIYQVADPDYGYDDTTGSVGVLPVAASLTTKPDDFGYPGLHHFFEEVWMLIPQSIGATMRLEAYRDGIAAPDVNRVVDLGVGSLYGWKAYKVPTARTPGTRTYIKATYTGAEPVDIEQLAFRAGVLNRRPMQPR